MLDKMIIFILQLTIIYNAINIGWKVKKIDNKEIILVKKLNEITDIDNNMNLLLKKIIEIK